MLGAFLVATPAKAKCASNFTPKHGQTYTFTVGQNFCKEERFHDRVPTQITNRVIKHPLPRITAHSMRAVFRPTSSFGLKQINSGVKGVVKSVGSIGKGAINITENLMTGALDILF